MTHFSDDEFVDLLDDALPATRRAHLQNCGACRAQASAMDAVLARAVESRGVDGRGAERHDADVPEPSPLFWDHLSARVRDAVAAPATPTWRDRVSWPVTAWAAGLASVALAVAVSHTMLPRAALTTPPASVASNAAALALRTTAAPGVEPPDDIEADEAWAVVRSMADQVGWDDTHDAGISARPDDAERMTLELSTREQSELARLLQRELKRSGP
jgi:hypothetical protein